MDRSTAVRRATPFAVFALVLGGVVLASVTRNDGGTRSPKALPINAATGSRAGSEDAARPAMGAPTYWTETRIPDSLLAGLPAEGPAYTVTAADEARVAALAKALGISGEVRKSDGALLVGTGDRVLQVLTYPGQPWFVGPQKVGVDRPVDLVGTGSSGSGSSGSGGTAVAVAPTSKPVEPPPPTSATEPAPDAPCPSPVEGTTSKCAPLPMPSKPPQPSDAEARAAAQPVLDALGLGDATVTFSEGWQGKEVTAAPVVGGLPTVGYETRVTVEEDGAIPYANGFLGRAGADDRYPLLDPREALKRGGSVYAAREDIAPLNPQPSPSPVVREATAVRLGLMFMPSYDAKGPAFLVPAWLLSFKESTWQEPYLALPDEYVATPPPPTGDPNEPVCDPAPCPTKGEVPPAPPADGGGTDGSTGTGTVEPDVATGAPE